MYFYENREKWKSKEKALVVKIREDFTEEELH